MPHPLAGQRAPASLLVDVAELERRYYAGRPDPANPAERVSFGTSGHRGTPLDGTLHRGPHPRDHPGDLRVPRASAASTGRSIWARTRTPCPARRAHGPRGAGGQRRDVCIERGDGFTPTPVVSHAILAYNAGRTRAWPTASSSRPRTIRRPTAASSTTRPTAGPPTPTSPAGSRTAPMRCSRPATRREAHALRAALSRGQHARDDFVTPYVATWQTSIDMEAIRAAGVRIGVDPLGGASLALLAAASPSATASISPW